jgi:predicted glycosyltransferase
MLKEQNQDLGTELEEHRRQISELRSTQKEPGLEDREKRKQEKMALMMAKFDTVRVTGCPHRTIVDLPTAGSFRRRATVRGVQTRGH